MALSEGKYTAEFLLSEATNGLSKLSRENVTVLSGQNLKAGHVVGRKLISPTFGAGTAQGSNTGNGVFGAVTMGTNAGARRGTYTINIVEPGANVGTFDVFGPDGLLIGHGAVATLFDSEIQFTLADGGTDFVSGDSFTVLVSAGTYKYKEYNPANTDGSQRPIGVLYGNVDATSADKAGVIVARHAEVRSGDLTWFAGASAAQIAIAQDALAALGIILRS
jgi:hypothetical protein